MTPVVTEVLDEYIEKGTGLHVIEVDEATHKRWLQEELDRINSEERDLMDIHDRQLADIQSERDKIEKELKEL